MDTGVGDGDGTRGRQEPVERMEMRMRWMGQEREEAREGSHPQVRGTHLPGGGRSDK